MPTKKPLSDNPACLPVLVPVSQARRLLCIGRTRLDRAIQSGSFPAPVQIAGKAFFRLKDLAPVLVLAGLGHMLPPDLAAAAGEDVAADDSA